MKERRLRPAGHLWRNKSELASDDLLWSLKNGRRSAGRSQRIDQLVDDSEYHLKDLQQPCPIEMGGENKSSGHELSARPDDDN